MLIFSKIDSDLSIYKKRKVVIFGAGNKGLEVCKKLCALGVMPAYFCDNDIRKWGSKVNGISVVPPKRIFEMEDDYVIQIAMVDSAVVEQQLIEIEGVDYISLSEFEQRIYDLSRYKGLIDESERHE